MAHIQAGGGTVADAKPDYEYEESRAKARGVVRAIELAAQAGGVAMRVLMVDNYDSFTYNLVQYLGELGAELEVVRNDAATRRRAARAALRPRRRLARARARPTRPGISRRGHAPLPGGRRARRSASASATSRSAQAFGGKVVRHVPVHGKTTEITTTARACSPGLPNPLPVGALSLAGRATPDLPDGLEATAHGGGVLMAMRHRELPAQRRPVPPRVRAHARRQAAAARTSLPNPVLTQAIDALASRQRPRRRADRRGAGRDHGRQRLRGARPPAC